MRKLEKTFHPAAINLQGDAGDIGRALRGEKRDSRADFFRLGHASYWRLIGPRIDYFLL